MALFKCKMCGGDLKLPEGGTLAECEYCGSLQTVPSADNEKKLTLFNRANRLRYSCDFDKAFGIYEALVAEFPDEAEAYWGLVLCKYGIEYVDDPATGKKIPTCHRSNFESVMEDSNFEQALENANPLARRVYRDEAKQIEEIRKGIVAVSANEEPYDIFICYKETNEIGVRTLDSVLAQDVYDALTAKGYRVFFSRVTLEEKLGVEYEPYIFAALNSAKVMLVFGTDYDYFNAVWVKNEWSRYLKLMAEDHNKHLIPCFKGIDAYDMPKEFAKLQAQDLGKIGAIQDLLRGIKKIIANDELRDITIQDTVTVGNNAASLVERAFLFLEDEDWARADKYCEMALDLDPRNARAYLGKLMIELQVGKQENLKDCDQPFDNNNNYQKAVRFADESMKKEIVGYIEDINNRNENARLDGIYKAAEKLMAENTEKAYKEAARLFASIRKYKNAAALSKECDERSEIIRKDSVLSVAIEKMNIGEAQGYEAAIALFRLIPGWRDADERMAVCQERIENLYIKKENDKKEKIYSVGKMRMSARGQRIAEYKQAILEFQKISGWKDADRLAAICKQKIDEIESKEKVNQEERERLTKVTQLEIRNRAKRMRTIAIVTVVAIVLLGVIWMTVVVPEMKYNDALKMMTTGKYVMARKTFEKLDGYKDSAELIVECRYLRANELEKDGNYKAAQEAYEALGDYKDSAEKAIALRTKYKTEQLKKAKAGDYVIFGQYEQDNSFSNGKEEVEWIVLSRKGNKILVISQYALESKRSFGGALDKGVTWDSCELRVWLNNDFIETAFTEEEKASIAITDVLPDKNPDHNVFPGYISQDQVFLLSITEANKYFSSSEARMCKPTAYAKAKAEEIIDPNGNCWWWLRSTGSNQQRGACVRKDGAVSTEGVDFFLAALEGGGGAIRPALWIDLSKI